MAITGTPWGNRLSVRLFQVISGRYLKSSVIITSHAGVATWAERFADPMMAAAILDRLLHHSIVVVTEGESFRMRQARSQGGTRMNKT